MKIFKNRATWQKTRKCWHLSYFTDAGNNEHAGVKNVAYRLNQIMLKAFDPSSEGFTHHEFSALAEKEIDFFKNFYKEDLEIKKKLGREGLVANFGYESIKAMGIRNDTDAQIIRDAIALDCSKIAQTSFFLYRGANFQEDSTAEWGDKNKPYSISYGASLFAGCLYDPGATAFYYLRKQQNAYAIPVPFDQFKESPFYIPTTHTLAQLFGNGEIFHARTKAWQGSDLKNIGGMNCGENGHVREHLLSNLTQNELMEQFMEYKNRAIQLK